MAGEEPVRLTDPETQTEYVIVKADVHNQIRALADETRAAYPLAMKVFGQDGRDDPPMDKYNAPGRYPTHPGIALRRDATRTQIDDCLKVVLGLP